MRFRRFLRNRAIGLTRRVVASAAQWRASRGPRKLELQQVRRRLELLLAGMYGQPMRIGAAGVSAVGYSGKSAPDIVLPLEMDARDGVEQAAAHYRLLAIKQAERRVRGSAAQALPVSLLERDLYTIAEGAAVDHDIIARAPGLAGALAERRARELAQRPNARSLSTAEQEVERLVHAMLGEITSGVGVTASATAEESLAWARAEAERIRRTVPKGTYYRGLPGLTEWTLAPITREPEPFPPMPAPPIGDMRSASTAAPSPYGSRAAEQQTDEGHGGEADASGTSSLTVPDTGTPGAERDADSTVLGAAMSDVREPRASRVGITYPEWDHYAGMNKPDAVTVHDEPAAEGDERWADDTLRTHAAIVRQVRARFGMLRAHRTRLRAQRAGDELDLDACVRALVDVRMHRIPNDRLYLQTRPARRTLAIALLVDVSGSTRATIADGQTILNVERMTVLLASEALDALGDPYAVLAFSGVGAHDVQLRTVKRFTGDDRSLVHRRIAGLSAMDNTRLGAALRHTTALLNAQPAEQRLLLLVSDGKPNDVYGYQGAYAIEDSRRALSDARACGVHPFCLTVDREETEYLPHLFGASGYRVLRAPEQLPTALLRVVEQMLPR